MILVDTNLISEPLRPVGDARVAAWLDRQDPESLFLSSVSLAELLLGVALLPLGRRRSAFEDSLQKLLLQVFDTRILNFDERAAAAYALLVSRARAAGRPMSIADGQIAAVAYVHNFAVATRDTAPFVAARPARP